jgi:hypothetical protein
MSENLNTPTEDHGHEVLEAAAEASLMAQGHGDWDAEFLKALQRRGLRLTNEVTRTQAPMPARKGYPHPSFIKRVQVLQ